MKKLAILIFFISINYATTFAQKPSFGVKIGITNSILIENQSGQTNGTSSINNVDARVYADFNYGRLTFQPGIGLFLKGGFGAASQYATSSTTYATVSNELTLTYIEIPLNVLYNIPIKAGKFFIGAGPYIAVAAAGKNKQYVTNYSFSNNTTSENDTETSVNFGNREDQLNRLDLGFNALGGFRFKNGIDIGIEYGQGLTNLYNIPNFSAKNATGSITIGYLFK